MIRVVRGAAIACLDLIPDWLQRYGLKKAALMSPGMKGEAFEHICCAISHRTFPQANELWPTNFGVARNLQCKLPLSKSQYVFGRPENLLSERATVALAAELCRDCTDFLDVGANDGIFTFIVNREAPKVRLHWFEPDGTLYARLRDNLSSNFISAFGNRAAVSDRVGTAKFLKNLTDDSSGSLTNHFSSHVTVPEDVETVSLSHYFRQLHIANALVKVDVEGAGEQVWQGTSDVAQDIQYLIMEIIGPETQIGLPGRIISEGGFYGYYIKDFDLIFSKNGAFQYVEPFWNWLFCRMDTTMLRKRLAGTRFRVIGDAT